jgi:ABC-type dipeptide/oligopeptide/nickel transport system ATPase subunit
VLGIVGESAGKSTTARLIIGLISPDAGDIVLDGEADPRQAEVRRCVQMVFQDSYVSLIRGLPSRQRLRSDRRSTDSRRPRHGARMSFCVRSA